MLFIQFQCYLFNSNVFYSIPMLFILSRHLQTSDSLWSATRPSGSVCWWISLWTPSSKTESRLLNLMHLHQPKLRNKAAKQELEGRKKQPFFFSLTSCSPCSVVLHFLLLLFLFSSTISHSASTRLLKIIRCLGN